MIKAHETIDDLFYNMKHQRENEQLFNNVQSLWILDHVLKET
jgi:hypothetical protein